MIRAREKGDARTASSFISLSFDDALDQHLDHAVPLLDRHGLRGTFYVHLSAPALFPRLDEWRAAASSGHELGNHTIFHPAVQRKSWVLPGNALEGYTLDRIRLEIEVADRALNAIDGGRSRTFAYPCSNPWVGNYGLVCKTLFSLGMRRTRWPGLVERRGLDFFSTRRSYVPVIESRFVAARVGGLTLEGGCTATDLVRRSLLPSAAVLSHHSFREIRGFIQRSLADGGWPILQFHGIGGGHYMNCELEVFSRLVDWLAEHHNERVVTVATGAMAKFGACSKTEESRSRDG